MRLKYLALAGALLAPVAASATPGLSGAYYQLPHAVSSVFDANTAVMGSAPADPFPYPGAASVNANADSLVGGKSDDKYSSNFGLLAANVPGAASYGYALTAHGGKVGGYAISSGPAVAYASGDIVFGIDLQGPNIGPQLISVNVSAELSATSSGNAGGGGYIRIYDLHGKQLLAPDHSGIFGVGCSTSAAQVCDQSVTLNTDLALVPNEYYFVNIDAGALAQSDNTGNGTAAGQVDPTFTVDPAFASEYTLVTGLIPASVNEPTPTLALLGGAISIALGQRRKRRH